MLKVFLASHGHMASGIKSSLSILFGETENLTCYDAYVDESRLQDALDAFFEKVEEDDQVVLLSDLFGGSVNTAMVPYSSRPNVYLVSGVNLAFVLELMTKTSINDEELSTLVEMSREVLLVNATAMEKQSLEDEEFF